MAVVTNTHENCHTTKDPHPMAVFRLMDLPGELGNRVYSHMVDASRPLEELTGNISDFFSNPGILCTNHQVNNEACSVINSKMIVVRVRPMTFRSLIGRSMKLPKESGFKRCGVEVDLSENCEVWQKREKILALKSVNCDLVWQLSGMPYLEEIHIWSRRNTSSDGPDFPGQDVAEAFFSVTAECFRDLGSGKKVTVEGDVDIQFTKGLLKDLNDPSIGWRLHHDIVPVYETLFRVYCVDKTNASRFQGRMRITSRMMSLRLEPVPLTDWAFGLVLSAESAYAVQAFVDGGLL